MDDEELHEKLVQLEPGNDKLFVVLVELLHRLKKSNERIEALEDRLKTPIRQGERK